MRSWVPFFVACSDWTDPEREITQHPDQQSPILRDNAYYQALREYKKTKHKIAFGWYGSWTAVGASYQTRLQSAPDSMDIISIWSQWHSLTPEQIADKEFVQKIKGTKVTFTIFSDKMPEPFLTEIGGGEYTDEAIEAYAKSLLQGLDGQVQLRRHRRRLRTRLRRFGAVRGT